MLAPQKTQRRVQSVCIIFAIRKRLSSIVIFIIANSGVRCVAREYVISVCRKSRHIQGQGGVMRYAFFNMTCLHYTTTDCRCLSVFVHR